MDSININIAGDLFLGRRIESIAKDNPASLFDEKIMEIFQNSDFNIINLESPLTDAGDEYQISKSGPFLKATPSTIGALDLLNVNLVTLANNHIYDYGDKGLSDTINVCKSQNIATVGAGPNLDQASEIFLKKIDQITIGVVNITENEWSIADAVHGGANPIDVVANTRTLHAAKQKADIVILIVHGGHERFHYPSPRMVDLYHYYAEEGASLVVGHHSHCISGYEIHNEVPIFYGLGNFLFDSLSDFEGWYEGVLLNIRISSKKEISWDLLPYQQCKGDFRVELLVDDKKQDVEDEIQAINEIIADPQKLKSKYNDLIFNQKDFLLSIFSTSNILNFKFFRSAVRRLGLEKFFLRKEQMKLILNLSRCESLRDISNQVIENYLKAK
ncbi:MAG: CapA family protein [Bacteroidales bacterium]|nr:CapA family protein [Bacteroidales bacterium]